jgi:hypothetical protein
MPETENLGSFFKENKKLAKDYFDTRLEIYRLQLIRMLSKSAGYIIWIIISLVLSSLLVIFLGLTTGFWLSAVTGSYTKGFGLTVLLILAVIIIVALLRKTLFVNPVIRNFIKRTARETENQDGD